MRYTLWSHDRLVGHTDLDIPTIMPTMRQGFVEPTSEGRRLLADATAVWRAMAEVKRGMRARGERAGNDDEIFLEALRRRESLHLQLRDETGAVFRSEHIRVTDLFDIDGGMVDEMCDSEEEEEADFEIRLSALSGVARDEALARRAERNAEIDASVAEVLGELEEDREFASEWPNPPEDPRWDTMQYLLQVHLESPTPDGVAFLDD